MNGAPTTKPEKAQDDLRKTNITLDAKHDELTEKKGDESVFDPSEDSTEFATQMYGDNDDEDVVEDEEETEKQKVLNLKQLLRSEYECRGSKKRKATSEAPDGAIATPEPKKARVRYAIVAQSLWRIVICLIEMESVCVCSSISIIITIILSIFSYQNSVVSSLSTFVISNE